MKKIFLTALIFSVVSCSVPEVPMDSLVERNGITYQVNSDKPYSGKAIIYFANGQVDLINTYKKGKIIQQEAFQQNGTPLYKEVFDKNGTIIEEEYYHDNGQLRTTISCEGGIADFMPVSQKEVIIAGF